MPFHKKIFKGAKKIVKKVRKANPFRKIRRALKPKKQRGRRPRRR